jgi:adenosylcobinamide-GDP ribazoletransferase
LVGGAIGVVLALVSLLPMQGAVEAFLLVSLWVVVTGGLHLDGLGDACDGLMATVSVERRLEIMKDPRAGTWAVVGIGLLLLGKFSGLLDADAPLWPLLIAAPVAGRWAMTAAVYGFGYARSGGLGAAFRDGLGRRQVGIATVSALGIVGVVAWWDVRVLIAVPVSLACAFGLGSWAAKRLGGGLTGDVYGMICEVTELGCVVGVALWAPG